MPWPALETLVKGTDVSIYQNPMRNTSTPTEGRIDWATKASENPEIRWSICRLSGSSSGIDPDGGYNFDQGLKAGFDMGVYVNMSPTRSVSWLMENWWKPAIGDRDPKLIVLDCESTHGQTPKVITKHIRDALDALKKEWPDAEIWIYSAAWWWNPNVEHGWEGNERFWIAHYIYVVQDPQTGDWRTAFAFSEMDEKLPIHNTFTPRLPKGVGIHQVEAWQCSNKGIIEPITRQPKLTPRVDLDYMKLAAYNRVFQPDQDQPDPDPEPVPVEVRVPAGKAKVKVTEV